jgi:hypothetical protein
MAFKAHQATHRQFQSSCWQRVDINVGNCSFQSRVGSAIRFWMESEKSYQVSFGLSDEPSLIRKT